MRIEFLETPVDILDMDGTLARCEDAMAHKEICVHIAMNAAKFIKMRDDEELHAAVTGADIIGIDGMGIILALRLFGLKNAVRVSGVDLMMALLAHCEKTGRRPYILGAKQDVLDKALAEAQKRWPQLSVAGSHHGYFGADDEGELVQKIAASHADCLFVAMPTPAKERFLDRHAQAMNVPFIMGVGGSIDILAGETVRAPKWMQRMALEWFYRLMQEPRKMFWRYASTNGKFIATILWGRLRGKRISYRPNRTRR